MFTRRRKPKSPETLDDLESIIEVKPDGHADKSKGVAKNSGDEIEKISQDFIVAQLESLKDPAKNTAALAPVKTSRDEKTPAIEKKIASPPAPAKTTPPATTVKPAKTTAVLPPTVAAVGIEMNKAGAQRLVGEKPAEPPSPHHLMIRPTHTLLKTLLLEIVDQDIHRQIKRLSAKK